MFVRTFWAASLMACSVLSFAQERDSQIPFEATVAGGVEMNSSVTAMASGPSIVAYCASCTGLISSTGNLYFTRYSINEFGSDSTMFLRTGKTSRPGDEILLYRESGDRTGFYYFGNVVWAFPGVYYGYFVANYNDFGVPVSQIKRVPLAGGAATVLAQSPAYIGTRDLVTDGATLFWADAGGIRSMPVGGGTVRTVLAGPSFSRIALEGSFVYYASGNSIGRVAKAGGTGGTVIQAASPVTAMYVHPVLRDTYIFWGEESGAVRSRTASGGVISTWQSPMSNRSVSSVGFDGTRAIWIDCSQPGNSFCSARTRIGSSSARILNAGVGARGLQWDATSMYWYNAGSINRYVH